VASAVHTHLSGLSHTRIEPPSMAELQTDFQRQQTLLSRVAAIEARERDERIRQGYLLAESEERHRPAPIAGPSRVHTEPSFSEATAEVSSRPSISSDPQAQAGRTTYPGTMPDVSRPTSPPSTKDAPAPQELETDSRPNAPVAGATHRGEPLVQHPQGDMQHPRDGLDTAAEPYPIPTPPSTRVVPPRETIDPSEHSSAEDLRKLAEEDTRRRIEQAGGEAVQPEVVDQPQAETLKPRRRGAK
jgi:NADH dehydrogenase [ubiquinone] 1 alpha subcomplex assembly factor 2